MIHEEEIEKSLYDYPQAYDAVMARTDTVVQSEVRSVTRLLARHGIGQGRILELACGACAHGIPLAQQGFQVTGIDRSKAMLAEAQRRSQAAGVSVCLQVGNVSDFALDRARFDAAIFMFETFPLITDSESIRSHFASVRRHLRPGGVYIVDIDAGRRGVHFETGEWGRRTVAFPGGCAEVWHEDLPGDRVGGTNHLVLHCRICVGDEVHETRDDWHICLYSPWMLELMTRTLDGWRLDGFYSWRDLSTDISEADHYFAVWVVEQAA